MSAKLAYLFDRTLDDCDQQFLRFWLDYPKKVDKAAAQRAWSRLSAVDRAAAVEGVQRYRRHLERSNTERRFVKYPAGWLIDRRWEDELDDETPITDLGRCFWNRNGNRDPHAGQCSQSATVQNPENGNCYCAAHGRALGLKVRAA